MASLFRFGVVNLVSNNLSGRLCKIPRIHVTPVAYLSSFDGEIPKKKQPPFPYWKTGTKIRLPHDYPAGRFDDNSKIIVVDGLPATGKSEFCQFLAKKFGLLYMPAPSFDELYVNYKNEDLRSINKYFALEDQYLDLETFYKHPNHRKIIDVQISLMLMRADQYRNALVHIFATGQGIVLNRSIYSDFVFADAMYKCGYITQKEHKYYEIIVKQLLPLFLRPQVVLYLDVPVKMAMDKIKQRGVPYEVNSSVFKDDKFLKEIDHNYKEKYINSLMSHAYTICFDWSKDVNLDSVILELEDLPVEEYVDEGKQEDWIFTTFDDLYRYRETIFTPEEVFAAVVLDPDDCPESLYDRAELDEEREEIMRKVFDPKYGFRETPDEKFWVYPSWRAEFVHRLTPRDFMYRNIEGAK